MALFTRLYKDARSTKHKIRRTHSAFHIAGQRNEELAPFQSLCSNDVVRSTASSPAISNTFWITEQQRAIWQHHRRSWLRMALAWRLSARFLVSVKAHIQRGVGRVGGPLLKDGRPRTSTAVKPHHVLYLHGWGTCVYCTTAIVLCHVRSNSFWSKQCVACVGTRACFTYLFCIVSTLHLNTGMQIAKILNSKCTVQGLAGCLTCSLGS